MFHYAHYEQVHGFWDVVNTVLGPVVPPQAFLERWFTEGVAQYYEGRLRRARGPAPQPALPGQLRLLRGDARRRGRARRSLALSQRELYPFSGAYLTGLYFIEWLVSKYGEDKLWELMDRAGPQLLLALRRHPALQEGLRPVDRRADGRVARRSSPPTLVVRASGPTTSDSLLADVGQLARLATHPASGTVAIVSSGNEQVPMLRILERDGSVRVETRLARLGPDRDYVYVGPGSMSGLSFTADGKFLFLLNDDLIDRGDTRAQIWKIDAQTGEVLEVFQDVGRGMGGSISGDGRTFTFVDFPAGHSRIIERELEVGEGPGARRVPPRRLRVFAAMERGAHPARLLAARPERMEPGAARGQDGTSRDLTTDGAFNYGAKWSDDTHLVFARTRGPVPAGSPARSRERRDGATDRHAVRAARSLSGRTQAWSPRCATAFTGRSTRCRAWPARRW